MAGGLKLWECTADLLAFLAGPSQPDWQRSSVVEVLWRQLSVARTVYSLARMYFDFSVLLVSFVSHFVRSWDVDTDYLVLPHCEPVLLWLRFRTTYVGSVCCVPFCMFGASYVCWWLVLQVKANVCVRTEHRGASSRDCPQP